LLELFKLVLQTHFYLNIICCFRSILRFHKFDKISFDILRVFFLRSKACMIFKVLIVIIH
jgi:hypothetical protein